MPTITLPQAGKRVGDGTVLRWRKSVGEMVKKGEVLLEVETEEGFAQVESPVEGRLSKVLVEAGKTVTVGTGIAVVDSSSEITKVNEEARPANGAAKQGATMGQVVPILMPKAGQSMEEGTLVKWHVQAGAVVKKGQVIFEIETDKATMEVEATDAGRVARIVVKEGETIKVLEPVAYLAENDADVEAFLGVKTPLQPGVNRVETPLEQVRNTPETPLVSAVVVEEGGRVKASPAARKFAEARGVDLATVGKGSGPGGRILSTDVPLGATAAAGSVKPQAAEMAKPQAVVPLAPGAEGVTRRKMSQMRKAIARNLLASKQTIPHFYMRMTFNADPMMSFYQGEKAKYPCSVNDVIVAACAKCVKEFAAFRSRVEGDEIVEVPAANIGVAVGMNEGLVVPVILGADAMSLKQIGAETKRIAAAAKGGKIEGMGQGVFTITNLGMFGVEEFSAIINPPEAAILAVGAVREEVIVSGGTLKAGRVMTVSLSSDHRIIDGMLAAKFLARLKEVLEYPQQLV